MKEKPQINAIRDQLDASEKLLEKRDIAARLSVTPRTIEHWMKRGLIPFIKTGPEKQSRVLFKLADVEARLKQVCGVNHN